MTSVRINSFGRKLTKIKLLFIYSDQLISLQKELIKTTEVEQRKYVEPSGSAGAERAAYYKDQKAKNTPLKIWKVGDKCMAKDATNGQ